jgi:ATP-dependent Zn protease
MKKLAIVFSVFAMLFITPAIACGGLNADPSIIHGLTITSSSFAFSSQGSTPTLTSIGIIKNSTNTNISDITIEVKYYDDKNVLVDTITQRPSSLSIPANGEATFRIQDNPAREKSSYSTQTIRITSAETPYNISSHQEDSNIFGVIFVWFPMIIFFGILWYLIRRTQGKKSPRYKLVSLVEEQNILFEKQNGLLTQLISTIENKR